MYALLRLAADDEDPLLSCLTVDVSLTRSLYVLPRV